MKTIKNDIELRRKEAEDARRKEYAEGLMEATLDKVKHRKKVLHDAQNAYIDAREELKTLEETPLAMIEVPEVAYMQLRCGTGIFRASESDDDTTIRWMKP